jgi:hypothetical protein
MNEIEQATRERKPDKASGARKTQDEAPPLIIAEWRVSGSDTARVILKSFNGFPIIDVRKWYRDAADELRPGRHGVSFNVKHLPALADAIAKALTQARAAGLVDDAAAGGGART